MNCSHLKFREGEVDVGGKRCCKYTYLNIRRLNTHSSQFKDVAGFTFNSQHGGDQLQDADSLHCG